MRIDLVRSLAAEESNSFDRITLTKSVVHTIIPNLLPGIRSPIQSHHFQAQPEPAGAQL